VRQHTEKQEDGLGASNVVSGFNVTFISLEATRVPSGAGSGETDVQCRLFECPTRADAV